MNAKEKIRLYRILYKRLSMYLDGGGAFGMDFRTCMLTYPQITKKLQQLSKELHY